jgi:hypothetical protein
MLTDPIYFSSHLGFMGFYEDRPPPHGHRTPSELAEDAILSALRGDFFEMPARLEQTGAVVSGGVRGYPDVLPLSFFVAGGGGAFRARE